MTWLHPEIRIHEAEGMLAEREMFALDNHEKAKQSFLSDLREETTSNAIICCRDQPTTNEHQTGVLFKVVKNSLEAWERIKNGTWGICPECEKPIPKNRLELHPEAMFCVPCKSSFPQKHRQPQKRWF